MKNNQNLFNTTRQIPIHGWYCIRSHKPSVSCIFDCCKQSLTRLFLPSFLPPIHPVPYFFARKRSDWPFTYCINLILFCANHKTGENRIFFFYFLKLSLKFVCQLFFPRRGSLLSTAIFVYAATAPVNGYSGGSLYARMGGKNWIRQMVVSAFLLPALVSLFYWIIVS